jgi:hypothetical protein
MHSCTAFVRAVAFLVVVALVNACSTTRPVTITGSQPLAGQIMVGDKVEVEKKDGTQLSFKVTEVSPEGLRGRDQFVPMEDIANAQVVEGAHPALVVFLVLVAATAVWFLADPSDVCGDWPAKPCDEDL